MNVPLLDLKAQFQPIRDDILRAVAEVFESQYFILGPRVQELEQEVARYCGGAHAVGVSSGTDALILAMMAEGIGPGDEVITSPYTFFATAGSVVRLGARPVFADIDPVTFNLSPRQIEARITARTRAIVPVHLYGQVADMDAIQEIARRRRLLVIEDACQAIGAGVAGRQAGTLGEYGCLSFFPSKNLGGAGDGGMVLTNDAARADHLRRLRVHGMEPKYYHREVGGNFRLDALQAAVLSVKLRHLDRWTEQRRANAIRYADLFAAAGVTADGRVALPREAHVRHVFNQYVIRASRRDELRTFLQSRQIATEIYYPVPLHLQECFRSLAGRPGEFPESEKAALETLALPIYPELSEEQAAWVVDSIAAFLKQTPR